MDWEPPYLESGRLPERSGGESPLTLRPNETFLKVVPLPQSLPLQRTGPSFTARAAADRRRLGARPVRHGYLQALSEFRHTIQNPCGQLKVDSCLADTSQPLHQPLVRFLGTRTGRA